MNKELTIKTYNGVNVTDSREVADMVGRNHAHLCRDIQGYIKVISQNPKLDSDKFFVESSYKSGTGKEYTCYLLTKQGCEMVANKMTGTKGILFTAEYVQAFNKMEQALKPQLPTDYLSALKALVASEEEKQQLQLENTHKQEVIQGLTEEISISDMRSILNRVIRKGGKYQERYSALYQAYKDTYHIDLKVRFKNYNEKHSPKCKSVLEYADKKLDAIKDLYKIACKLFESDVDKLVNEMYNLR